MLQLVRLAREQCASAPTHPHRWDWGAARDAPGWDANPPSPHVLARDAVHVPCCVCEFPTKSVTRRGPVASATCRCLVTLVTNSLDLLVFLLLRFRRTPTTIPFAPPMLSVCGGRDPPSPHVMARDAVHVPCYVCNPYRYCYKTRAGRVSDLSMSCDVGYRHSLLLLDFCAPTAHRSRTHHHPRVSSYACWDANPPSPHVLARDAVHVPCCVCDPNRVLLQDVTRFV